MAGVGGNVKKVSTPLMVLAACVLGIALGLFGLNFWHATNCASGRSADAMEKYVESLNRRLLQAESQVIKNEIFMDKLLISLQYKLMKLEKSELDIITKQSQDEAVKIALILASQPAPPIPDFEIDPKYKDAESIADLIDDVFGRVGSGQDYAGGSEFEDKKSGGASSVITDPEALKNCNDWKEKYAVVIGVSWGNLPYDLQQKWMEYSCDYHLVH